MISRIARITGIRLLLFLLASGTVCFAQKQDKKESSPKATQPSSSKFYQYKTRDSKSADDLDEAEQQAGKDPVGALDKVQEALAESIAQNNVFSEGRSYLLIGDINTRILEWKLAAQNYEKAYNVLKPSYQSSNEFKRALLGLAKANMEAGNHQASVDNYTEIFSLKTLSSDERRESELALAEVYYRMGNYDESLKIVQSVQKPEAAKEKKVDNRSAGYSNSSFQSQRQGILAKIFAKKNDFEKTKVAADSTLIELEASGSQGAAAAPAQNSIAEVADVLREQKRYDDEIELRNRAIELNTNTLNFSDVSKDKVELSKTLEAKGATSEALKTLLEAATIADTIDDPHEQANAYLSLAGLYEKNGQNNNALQAYRKYSQAVQRVEAETSRKMEERSVIIRKQNDIEELSNTFYIDRSDFNTQEAIIGRQQIVIIGLGVIILIIGVTSIFIYRSAQSSRRANQLLALKSLRSQMNPHFIFNALNSVNHFIAQQDERTANKFLSEFSQLMRLVLEYSQEDFITLQKEQEILTLYMKLEHYRFRDKFEYEIDIDESINAESISVPPMLIQPYLENAVWHGLRYRDTTGFLKLTMRQEDSKLLVSITDNGIGRKKSSELKTDNQKKHRSTGLKNIKERLSILNTVYRTHYEVNVSDGPEGIGTTVEIKLPLNNLKA